MYYFHYLGFYSWICLRFLCFKNIKFGIICLLPMDPWLHLNLLTHLQIDPTYSYLQLWCIHIFACLHYSFSLHNNIEYETTESGKMLSWHNSWDPAWANLLQEWFPCTTALKKKKINGLTYLSALGLSCGTQELWNALLHVKSLVAACRV